MVEERAGRALRAGAEISLETIWSGCFHLTQIGCPKDGNLQAAVLPFRFPGQDIVASDALNPRPFETTADPPALRNGHYRRHLGRQPAMPR